MTAQLQERAAEWWAAYIRQYPDLPQPEREHMILIDRFATEPPLILDHVAEKMDISRERVRQLEATMLRRARHPKMRPWLTLLPALACMAVTGMNPRWRYARTHQRVCPSCYAPYKGKGDTCRACRRITLPCVQCGQPVTRTLGVLLHAKDSRYTGRVFCNRTCFGQWGGKHHGWGSPDHPNRNKTHCPQGHPRTPENTYAPPSAKGWQCRACAIARSKAQHEKRKREQCPSSTT